MVESPWQHVGLSNSGEDDSGKEVEAGVAEVTPVPVPTLPIQVPVLWEVVVEEAIDIASMIPDISQGIGKSPFGDTLAVKVSKEKVPVPGVGIFIPVEVTAPVFGEERVKDIIAPEVSLGVSEGQLLGVPLEWSEGVLVAGGDSPFGVALEKVSVNAGAPVVLPLALPDKVPGVLPGATGKSPETVIWGIPANIPGRLPDEVTEVTLASGVLPGATSKSKGKAVVILNSDLSDEILKKARRTAKRKAKAGHLLGGVRLTPRDYLMLAFLARYRVATVGQLARAFGTSQTALRNRLPRLRDAGLITWAWGAQSKPKLWFITEAGLDTVGMDLTAPTIKWGQLRHTLGLVDLGINFEGSGEVVITEREIRAASTRHLPTSRMKSAIGLVALGEINSSEKLEQIEGFVRANLILPVKGRGFGHIPDMVLSRQAFPNGMSGNISIELELTRKSISEWKTILTTYRDSALFSEVYYFVLAAEMKRSLNSVIKAIGAEDKIKVLNFNPVDLTADPHVTGGGVE